MLFFSVSLRAEETSQEKLAAHKAAGGRETQQYPVPTGSDLSNASGARDVRRKSYRCSRPVLLNHNAAMFALTLLAIALMLTDAFLQRCLYTSNAQ